MHISYFWVGKFDLGQKICYNGGVVALSEFANEEQQCVVDECIHTKWKDSCMINMLKYKMNMMNMNIFFVKSTTTIQTAKAILVNYRNWEPQQWRGNRHNIILVI